MTAEATAYRLRLAERLGIDHERLRAVCADAVWVQVSEAGPEPELLERCAELLRRWSHDHERDGHIFFTQHIDTIEHWEWDLEIHRVRMGYTTARHRSDWLRSPFNPDGRYYRGY